MGPRMAENRQSGTRPYDDVVVICRGKRQSVVKALTSAVGQTRKSSVSLGMSGVGGQAEGDFGRLDVSLEPTADSGVAERSGTLIADHAAREAHQDLREGRATWLLCHLSARGSHYLRSSVRPYAAPD